MAEVIFCFIVMLTFLNKAERCLNDTVQHRNWTIDPELSSGFRAVRKTQERETEDF